MDDKTTKVKTKWQTHTSTLSVRITGALPRDISQWPSNIKDEVEAGLIRLRKRTGLPFTIVSMHAAQDLFGNWRVYATAQCYTDTVTEITRVPNTRH